VKDIDFLPEWYKEKYRRRMHMRHQYVVLAGLVCAMILYNVIATHRINTASAGIDRLDDQRRMAEQVIFEFDTVNRHFNEHQAKADLVAQMDSKIDISAVLAELSHIIGGRVVLSRLEFISEALASTKYSSPSGTVVRLVGGSGDGKSGPLGDVRFRIVMTGVAANASDVGDLACRLEESPYFRQVIPSVPRSSKIEVPASVPISSGSRSDDAAKNPAKEALQVSEFEITCYLANYEEIRGR
jgi:hypothetical protein